MQTVLTDSLEKVLGEAAPRPAELHDGAHVSGFLGEVLSVQVALRTDEPEVRVGLSGGLADRARLQVVRRVPVSSPAPEDPDAHYLVTEPGEYPDLLEPVTDGLVHLTPGRWEALWIDVVGTTEADPGDHELTLSLTSPDSAEILGEQTVRLRLHPHRLPPLSITNTHWFHADSLSTYYDVEVFSERHWELIEAFLASAREMDVTSVLTPTWTPPLDTAEGHTRPFVQLIGIRETDGEYSFDLSRLDRWLGICRELGFTGLEIAHLFTQWGAAHTPAIQVETADRLAQRFGWHVAATDPAYRRLLESLIPALREHLDRAWDGAVLWHISDEPHENHIEAYRAAKAQVEDLLKGAQLV
ncbi:glycoside hydrolase domain-containing protein, partial [Brachybacterium sp.]|uniref:glycoside hydrolase domain-containing protein n=1 Tax=Brachybacterium sp. TaxID=1891286 RepID=UPI002ED614B9